MSPLRYHRQSTFAFFVRIPVPDSPVNDPEVILGVSVTTMSIRLEWDGDQHMSGVAQAV